MGINSVAVQQLTLPIQADHLAAGTKARVDAHDPFGSQRGGQQKLAQVVGKDADGFGIGTRFDGQANLGFHGARQESFIGIMGGQAHLLGIRAVAGDEKVLQDGDGQFRLRSDGEVEDVLFFCAAHGQDPVGGCLGHGFLPLKIVFIFGAFLLLTGHHPTTYDRFFKEQVTNP